MSEMGFGPYADIILSCYALAVLVMSGLVLWLLWDGQRQERTLADLEARGVRRRSAEG